MFEIDVLFYKTSIAYTAMLSCREKKRKRNHVYNFRLLVVIF